MSTQLSCEPGASETGIGPISQNGYLKRGISPWIQTSTAQPDHYLKSGPNSASTSLPEGRLLDHRPPLLHGQSNVEAELVPARLRPTTLNCWKKMRLTTI